MLAVLASALAAAVPQPTIVQRPIPFPAARKQQMAAYARRHYGIDSYRLRDPKVIVQHYTVTATFQQTYNTFAPDRPDPELRELPGTCAHYVIDRDGTIYQLVRRSIMCRHTVGLNYAAIGIEHVGFSDGEVLGRKRQLRASARLTQWLRCRHGIPVKGVIGHAESLGSPFYKELDPDFRGRTHGDFGTGAMRTYRGAVRGLGPC